MSRLRLINRLLSAILLAILARTIVSGPSIATELSGAIIALLLLASLLLTREGRQLKPQPPTNPRINRTS
jgi:hypothetical protein